LPFEIRPRFSILFPHPARNEVHGVQCTGWLLPVIATEHLALNIPINTLNLCCIDPGLHNQRELGHIRMVFLVADVLVMNPQRLDVWSLPGQQVPPRVVVGPPVAPTQPLCDGKHLVQDVFWLAVVEELPRLLLS
jgi:hypothetical protein